MKVSLREYVEVQLKALIEALKRIVEDVQMLREWKSNMQGRSSVAIVLSVLGIIIALITLIIFIFNSYKL